MRLPQATALAGATAAVAAVLTVCTVSADTAAAPVAPYPQAAPDPVDGNVVPQLVDDDELVHVQLAPDGAVRGMVDDVRIKLMGQGDFAMRLPGPVLSVADLGGESVPGLQNGHVSFLGRVDGIKHVAAQATLNPSLYADRIPLGVAITYLHDGSPVGAAALARTRGDVEADIALSNRTAQTQHFLRAPADPAFLAAVLEDLRVASRLYTPELDLQAIAPLPAALPLIGPAVPVDATVYVPMQITVTVNLPAGVRLTSAPGAQVFTAARGTQVKWSLRLPADVSAGGDSRLQLRFVAQQARVPAIDVRAAVQPLPVDLYTPPGGGPWTAELLQRDRIRFSLLGQEGAASLHRIADARPLVGRPGAGPELVAYDLAVQSGSVEGPPTNATSSSLRPNPWAVLVAVLCVIGVGANAWWAWSRH